MANDNDEKDPISNLDFSHALPEENHAAFIVVGVVLAIAMVLLAGTVVFIFNATQGSSARQAASQRSSQVSTSTDSSASYTNTDSTSGDQAVPESNPPPIDVNSEAGKIEIYQQIKLLNQRAVQVKGGRNKPLREKLMTRLSDYYQHPAEELDEIYFEGIAYGYPNPPQGTPFILDVLDQGQDPQQALQAAANPAPKANPGGNPPGLAEMTRAATQKHQEAVASGAAPAPQPLSVRNLRGGGKIVKLRDQPGPIRPNNSPPVGTAVSTAPAPATNTASAPPNDASVGEDADDMDKVLRNISALVMLSGVKKKKNDEPFDAAKLKNRAAGEGGGYEEGDTLKLLHSIEIHWQYVFDDPDWHFKEQMRLPEGFYVTVEKARRTRYQVICFNRVGGRVGQGWVSALDLHNATSVRPTPNVLKGSEN